MTEEEANQLRKENQELREALKQTQELLRVALARIGELEKQKTPLAFVKANVKRPAVQEKKPRKKRDAKDNRARPRSVPTEDSWSIGWCVAQIVICAWEGSAWPECAK